ncbi:hypothetical protein LX32DRAFT_38771 [Colletotrichum zoysiae]|uniref:Uncharacterized protein n=1 Tax=Colletotrichum zoysiae TaxID=1216348 RepID=A0AAD9HBT7_9PEZI|nr:hypothetical protein LX32DRAFT_38771 [Colletotrichum zoysiae]
MRGNANANTKQRHHYSHSRRHQQIITATTTTLADEIRQNHRPPPQSLTDATMPAARPSLPFCQIAAAADNQLGIQIPDTHPCPPSAHAEIQLVQFSTSSYPDTYSLPLRGPPLAIRPTTPRRPTPPDTLPTSILSIQTVCRRLPRLCMTTLLSS